uniref:HM00016 protein n=1 Tax=Heliconius melpomene TaxID=34740 RepID=C9S277_HELME|nr:HM00016 [Heliconius melpomene]
MEKPDANGCVNITWPSKTIPHGGVFHTKVLEPSAARQDFLKLLLEESKLTIAQRRKNAFTLRQEEVKQETKPRPQPPSVRPRTSRRRSLSAIRASETLSVDHYCPLKTGEDREKLKDKLANIMTYGDTDHKPPSPPRITKQKSKIPTKKEQWNDLLTQIRERAEWLAEMEDLGQAGPHRDLIKDQIAERMRALDALGVDSHCSSARSSATGFSVLYNETARSSSSGKIEHISGSNAIRNRQPKYPIRKSKYTEENVAAYEKLSPLQYSPRRRV